MLFLQRQFLPTPLHLSLPRNFERRRNDSTEWKVIVHLENRPGLLGARVLTTNQLHSHSLVLDDVALLFNIIVKRRASVLPARFLLALLLVER